LIHIFLSYFSVQHYFCPVLPTGKCRTGRGGSMISEVFRQRPANGGEDDQGLMSNGSEQSEHALALPGGPPLSSTILGGILIGSLLDRWLGSDPWLTITGIVLGLTGAIIGLIRVLNRLNRDN